MALLALVFTSPWVSIPFSNEHAYSTIKREQFDILKALVTDQIEIDKVKSNPSSDRLTKDTCSTRCSEQDEVRAAR